MIRVAIIDHDPKVRDRVAALLAMEPGFDVVARHAAASELLVRLPEVAVDVAVVDLQLPGREAHDLCQSICARHPTVRVVFMSRASNDAGMLDGFSVGARGFFLKDSDPRIIRQAVRAVSQDGTFIDPAVAGRLVALALEGQRTDGPFGLSLEELRVLEHLPRGLSGAELAAELGISDSTAGAHIRTILKKLDVANPTEAAAVAIRHGLA